MTSPNTSKDTESEGERRRTHGANGVERLRRTLGEATRLKVLDEYDIQKAVQPVFERLAAAIETPREADSPDNDMR